MLKLAHQGRLINRPIRQLRRYPLAIKQYNASRLFKRSKPAAEKDLRGFKRPFNTRFAVFNHQFAASVYLLNAQFRRHDQ